ncbi:EutN/CcmL family microcompartment protein [Clostridium luticellarii]|jgi:ethanolamine utilization protein EutN|uniref:Ethanolamine utilization protein EutN n=1 Tax=Clostridium luticellarii TaxID=1691940 RepID=A0A2T0BPC6_9CLOT|nr:EutN/CcmL family microcompartment protein [Clostridium luticellarii]MCI1945019.1 EutN/CcmL family microcompartment protein [Clostridium luticellarii]MCI1967582.1 EutN/CcmL family microcompartment protein [Clostridium luticellarii]MCI1995720.1 EutN/CcmL family microcompartment protein [Clostridium luticellarii]MCI2040058.1 EutN/CcmL family microcompartment protein [Clostridium luticellarii]PRR85738.1 Ethanolamine utilization protein EutN [Clostridium luticellarii]
MFLAKVVGNVVSTQKDEKLIGSKLLIIKKIDEDENIIGEPVVAIDTVGAGINEIVIVVTGSGARNATEAGSSIPADTSIVGIVDEVEWNKR